MSPPPGVRAARRRTLLLSDAALVETAHLDGAPEFPLVVTPRVDGLDLGAWVEAHRELLLDWLHRHAAVLFRGFGVGSAEQFRQAASGLSPELLDYRERAAPRREVTERVYTSTEYPADQVIPLHHEMSYSHHWPKRIWFFCEQPAERGGRTPIADDRRIQAGLPMEIKRRFLEHGVMYVRNYGGGVDLSWREVFQTGERAEVEAYCRRSGIAWEWLPQERLRTRQVRQAVITHPVTGDTLWFNHAHMFHSSSLPPAEREALLLTYTEQDLPRNAFYGDGEPIDDGVLDVIRRTYDEAAVRFDWRRGDVLVLDNMLASHGREAFHGARCILVALSDLYAPSGTP